MDRNRGLLVVLFVVALALAAMGTDSCGTSTGDSQGAGQSACTPGYSRCLKPASDYDCAGGTGDGPRYVQGPIRVTGSDPYGLDADGNGVGCETY
jgi:hypothetical protein